MVRPRRVAVLGGEGFIGQHLAVELRRNGHMVCTVDVKPGAGKCLDLRYPQDADRAVADCEWVVHLAADMGGVAYFHSDKDWGAALDNGRMTSNVLDACVMAGVERLLFTSSACAYPVEAQRGCQAPRLTEDMLGYGTPDQLYGAEKLQGARMVAGAPLDGRVAVLHTVYGPGQEATGQRAKFPPSVAYKALRAAQDGGPLELWGDGQQRRSYLPVSDAVVMLRTLLEADEAPSIVNVGAEGAVTCEEVAWMCIELAGAPAEVGIWFVDGPVGVRARDCSMDLWREHFGEPPCRPLRDGFAELIRSLR